MPLSLAPPMNYNATTLHSLNPQGKCTSPKARAPQESCHHCRIVNHHMRPLGIEPMTSRVVADLLPSVMLPFQKTPSFFLQNTQRKLRHQVACLKKPMFHQCRLKSTSCTLGDIPETVACASSSQHTLRAQHGLHRAGPHTARLSRSRSSICSAGCVGANDSSKPWD